MVTKTYDSRCDCAFCGKGRQNGVKSSLQGPTVYFADGVSTSARDLTDDQQAIRFHAFTSPKPNAIKVFFGELKNGASVSRDEKRLSVAVYQHYKRIELAARRRSERRDSKIKHSFDRTELAREDLSGQTLARMLTFLFTIVDATTPTTLD